MRLKTIDNKGKITLIDYDTDESRRIFIERNSYILRCEHHYGSDYGASQVDENSETTYEEIIPERILVKDDHFYGAIILSVYEIDRETQYEETILTIEGNNKAAPRNGYYFSNDDHDRWDYIEYYLEEDKR